MQEIRITSRLDVIISVLKDIADITAAGHKLQVEAGAELEKMVKEHAEMMFKRTIDKLEKGEHDEC